MTVEITNESPLETTPVVQQLPDCNEANGIVQLQVDGGSGNYSFSWGDSGTRNDLAAGIYSIIVIDQEMGCIDTSVILC